MSFHKKETEKIKLVARPGVILHRSGACQPFELRTKEGVGRYLVATRDIQPFEVILEDACVGWGPFVDLKIVCLACMQEIKDVEEERLT